MALSSFRRAAQSRAGLGLVQSGVVGSRSTRAAGGRGGGAASVIAGVVAQQQALSDLEAQQALLAQEADRYAQARAAYEAQYGQATAAVSAAEQARMQYEAAIKTYSINSAQYEQARRAYEEALAGLRTQRTTPPPPRPSLTPPPTQPSATPSMEPATTPPARTYPAIRRSRQLRRYRPPAPASAGATTGSKLV
jgi:hypothetical protein